MQINSSLVIVDNWWLLLNTDISLRIETLEEFQS